MSTIRCLATALLIVLVAGLSASAEPLALYVSPTGNDAWSGSLPAPNKAKTDGPFATLQRAQQALRTLPRAERDKQGVTIMLREGSYSLAAPLRFTDQDSGTANAQTVIGAYRGESVTVSGGRAVRQWRPYMGDIIQADVSGISELRTGSATNGGSVTPYGGGSTQVPNNELFCDGARMDLARWPNVAETAKGGGWAFTAGVPSKGQRTQFYYDGDEPKNWKHPELAQVHIFASYDWSDCYSPVASIDSATHLVTLAKPTDYDIAMGRRYYVRNVFEELDAPGEWYLDRAASTLYVYPPAGDIAKRSVEISVLPTLMSFDHAHDIVVSGLAMTSVTGDAIEMRASSRIRIEASDIANTGKSAVRINDCDSCVVDSCRIHDTGVGGVIAHGGDRKTLTPSKVVISNNHIYRFGRLVKCYTPSVSISGVGMTVTHNLMHDGPHSAILVSGNDHIISFNEIHHVCLETSDCGAIYMGRDWTFRGNSITCNKIHDVPGFGYTKYDQSAGEVVYSNFGAAQGVYLDDGVSGFDVTGNIIYRIADMGVQLGGGRDHRIVNNVIVDTARGIGIDARYMTWDAGVLRERLAAVPFSTPPWSERYPKLSAPMRHDGWPEGNEITGNVFARSAPDTDPTKRSPWFRGDTAVSYQVPSDATTIDRNIYWNAGGKVNISARFIERATKLPLQMWDDWQKTGFDTSGLSVDPQFVDVTRDDYRLRATSPAYKIGIPAIPVADIGLLPTFPDRWRPAADAWDNGPVAKAAYRVPLTLTTAAPDIAKPAAASGRLTARHVVSALPLTIVKGDALWPGMTPGNAVILAESPTGLSLSPISRAWVAWDDTNLYFLFRNDVDGSKPLAVGTQWGGNDAVEVALRDPSKQSAPILVWRGYPNGQFETSSEAGASGDATTRAAVGVGYAAQIASPASWSAAWRIPFAAIGIDPARTPQLDCNLTVRKTAGDQWEMWRATGGTSWDVDHTGKLILAPVH
ncbi:MAG TPA: right-handed parallel beta-helix repeat-containing protein [Capsulimonadaceae bacterium]|jgi:hypothetical protein